MYNMALLRTPMVFILIVIGLRANIINGDCSSPVFANPYGIQIHPDDDTYTDFYKIEMNCTRGLENHGLPPYSFCQFDGSWNDYVPTNGLCLKAQCFVSEEFDSDINVTTAETGGPHQTIFDNNEVVYFSCATLGQLDGAKTGTCYNGTFVYDDGATPAECSAYCPVYLEELGVGLYYDDAFSPVINETNTLYYENENKITYRCSDGYEGPKNRTPSDDGTSTCSDGSWDPPEIPTCMEITTAEMTTDIQASPGSTSEPVLTTDDLDVTTMELTTAMWTTMIADQSTIAIITTTASTTEGLATSPPIYTPPSTTPMTPTDSSTTSVVTTGMASATVVDDVTTATSDAMSVTPEVTTVTSSVTAISTETTTPTVPDPTTKSDSTSSLNSTASLPETTNTESVRSTSSNDATKPSSTESKETTESPTTSPTTPERTEKPLTTPLPCGGECKATQVCNAENKCECRPDYYQGEEDTCKEPESIDVTIKITKVNGTDAEYKDELEDPSSPDFKKLEIDVCEPFDEIYANDSEYIDCRVLEFREGSIIVNYVLTFAENSNQSPSTVNKTVQQELQNPNGPFAGDYEFDNSSLVVTSLDECIKEINDCDQNANCTDQRENGYTCECQQGFDDVGIPNSLPGRECMKPTDPQTTARPMERGLERWKVVVGVTVPIISILTITIVGLTCWQYHRYRRLQRTSQTSTKMRTFPYDDDTRGSSDHEASRPGSMMIINNDGVVQEMDLPWRSIPPNEEFIFAPDNDKGRTQTLPMVDHPKDYAGSASFENDPLGNIVGSYDNYTF